jgi:hypothetical protein
VNNFWKCPPTAIAGIATASDLFGEQPVWDCLDAVLRP